MRRGAGIFLAVVLGVTVSMPCRADENSDLDLIPNAANEGAKASGAPTAAEPASPAAPAAAGAGRYYIEDAATLSARRGGLVVPLPPPRPYDWQNRTSLDILDRWHLAETIDLSLSDRFNVTEQSGIGFPTAANLRNDFREGYLTWQPFAANYLELGRINVRNGVGVGFNPTDFFKTRTLIDQASEDPRVLQQDRLGTLMARDEMIWQGGAASVAVAPRLYAPTALVPAFGLQHGFNPHFDRTNANLRLLLSATADIADLSPQALVYHQNGQDPRFGLNLSRTLGQRVVAHVEWAGGRQPTTIVQALNYGKETGTLPANAPTLLATDTASTFRNDLAAGFSWTDSVSEVTINLEYEYHQAGFSAQDWRDWFKIGARSAAAAGELWYFRGFANDQQQPLTRHEGFIDITWADAFVQKLNFSAFAFVNLYDGSILTQGAVSYDISRAWTVSGYLGANIGGPRTEHGSFPQSGSAILEIVRYL